MSIRKPTKRQQQYWDNVLHDHNLGMDSGDGSSKTSGKRRVEYAGGLNELEIIESQEFGKKSGRRKVEGQPD